MNLSDRINEDLKAAMREKDQKKLRALRAIKSAILLFKTDGSGRELTDDLAIQMLQKLVKQRKDSLEIYEKQNREDLAVVEREEIEVIEKYLPEQMSDDDLRRHLSHLIQQEGAAGMKDMGRIMGLATKELSGQAEGKRIANIVRQLLNA